jgi:hypothetical protein
MGSKGEIQLVLIIIVILIIFLVVSYVTTGKLLPFW